MEVLDIEQDQQFDLDLWQWELNINRIHLFPRAFSVSSLAMSSKGVKGYWVDNIF